MRLQLLLALCLAAVPQAFGQSAAPAADASSDPHALLAAALPFYAFNDATLKPWHLKASYQLYDLKGNPTEKGTWEYWWASPKVNRMSWTRKGVEHTTWTTADGSSYYKDSGAPLKYFEGNLTSYLFYPLPFRTLLDSKGNELGIKTVGNGAQTRTCVSATDPFQIPGTFNTSPVPDVYCFDPPTKALLTVHKEIFTTGYGQIVKTQGRYLARQVVVFAGKIAAFSFNAEEPDFIEATDPALTPAADSAARVDSSKQITEGQPGILMGRLLKNTPPEYPISSKEQGEQGVVILEARIGKDGKIKDLDVVAAPSLPLANAAINAVKSWTYSPYLLNGQPVEVETTINVVFTLGH